MERCALTQLHHPFIYCHHHNNKLEEENAFCAALGFFSASFPFWVFSFSDFRFFRVINKLRKILLLRY